MERPLWLTHVALCAPSVADSPPANLESSLLVRRRGTLRAMCRKVGYPRAYFGNDGNPPETVSTIPPGSRSRNDADQHAQHPRPTIPEYSERRAKRAAALAEPPAVTHNDLNHRMFGIPGRPPSRTLRNVCATWTRPLHAQRRNDNIRNASGRHYEAMRVSSVARSTRLTHVSNKANDFTLAAKP